MDALPAGRGYAELTAGVRGLGRDFAAFGRAEVGWKPNANVSLFGFGEVNVSPVLPPSWMAGVGARFTW